MVYELLLIFSIGTVIFAILSVYEEKKKELKIEQYKECIDQTISMLRAYNREPDEEQSQPVMAQTIVSEMIK